MTAVATLAVVYDGGPLDGHDTVVSGVQRHRWAKWTDPGSGVRHFYELCWERDHWVMRYRPEHTR